MGDQHRRMEQWKPVVAMVGVQIIYAGTTLSGKAALQEGLSPLVFVVYRQVFATLASASSFLFSTPRIGDRRALGLKGFGLLFFTALVGVTTKQLLSYVGMDLASASMVSAMSNTVPAITFLMAASAGLEKVNIKSPRSIAKVFGTIICVAGAIAMALFKGPRLMNANSQTLISMLHVAGKNWKLGCLLLLANSCCWSLGIILQVPLCKNYVDPLSLSRWMNFLSALQSATMTYLVEPDLNAWKLNSTKFLYCLYAGVVGSSVGIYMESWCISKRGPVFTAAFNPLLTVVVDIVAILLFHERLYFISLVGAIAVVVGLYVVLWGKAEDFNDNTRMPLAVDESSNSSETDFKHPLLHTILQKDEAVRV